MVIHQLLPRFDAGDAVSSQAIAIRDALRDHGYESHVYAQRTDEFGARDGRPEEAYRPYMESGEDILIYHYLFFCNNYQMYLETSNRKILIYHNITPPEFYEEFDPETARFCRMGRELLPRLSACDLALGVSDFNRRDLVAAGFAEERTGVLPISPSGQLTGAPEDPALLARLRDGKLNLLFVGRVVPNKRVDDLVRLFRHYHHNVNASSRLIVVGSLANAYADYVIDLAKRFQLDDKILFLGKVDDAALKTCYTSSHFYVSMSEHEGFCVPLLEAFSFGLPVLAYAAGAVPETMGDAGVLCAEKDLDLLAEMVENLRRDPLARERIVDAQRDRLRDFSHEAFLARLDQYIGPFLGGEAR